MSPGGLAWEARPPGGARTPRLRDSPRLRYAELPPQGGKRTGRPGRQASLLACRVSGAVGGCGVEVVTARVLNRSSTVKVHRVFSSLCSRVPLHTHVSFAQQAPETVVEWSPLSCKVDNESTRSFATLGRSVLPPL